MSEQKISDKKMLKEKKVLKEKKKHSPKKEKNGLNVANNEKLDNKKIIEIKKDILDIDFEPFLIHSNTISKMITKVFGKETTNLNGYSIDFFYSEKLDELEIPKTIVILDLFSNDRLEVVKYISNLKCKLRDALNINKIMKKFSENITYLD